MECLQQQLRGVSEHKCTVHNTGGVGEPAAGAASKGQGLPELEPLPQARVQVLWESLFYRN